MSDVRSLNGQLSDALELRRRIFSIVNMVNGREVVREKMVYQLQKNSLMEGIVEVS